MMKFAAAIVLIFCILTGCTVENRMLDQAMELRKEVLNADSCSFEAIVTADYQNEIYTFQMECATDNTGTMDFIVADPETISGITGKISNESAALTFDDTVLAFPMLADGQLTPVSAPWIFINTLRSGYLNGCSKEEDGICIYIDDSFEENPLRIEIYTNQDRLPIHADIIWQGYRVLSMDIRNFTLQ